MSYYVQPIIIAGAVNASRIDLEEFINTSAAGTGSATVRQYFGLYRQSSDSLSLVSSWLGGFNISQNSATAVTLSVVTGSASVSIVSFGGNSSANMTGTKLVPIAQGAGSYIAGSQYYGVVGMHILTAGISPVSVGLCSPNTVYLELGYATSATSMAVPMNGAFSATSSATLAGSGQYRMPASVATNAITATRTNEQLRPLVLFRGA
jgi:hypothetical protein